MSRISLHSHIMGAAGSKVEEDKALQLCRERTKFVRQALDGRCSLAAAHVMYIQSLRNTGIALGMFVDPDAQADSSSMSATPAPLELTEKSLSQFSLSSPSFSNCVDASFALSPSPSLPTSTIHQANHMKFTGSFSKQVQERLPSPVTGTVISSSSPRSTVPQSTEEPGVSALEDPSNPHWDFFGFFHPIDNQFSSPEGKSMNQGFENADAIRRFREEEGIPDLEDDDEKGSFHGSGESQGSVDEFDDEPPTETLVRRFKNVNRVNDEDTNIPPTLPLARSAASKGEVLNAGESEHADLPSLMGTRSANAPLSDAKGTTVKEDSNEKKVTPKDFTSSVKSIRDLFIKASESGKEVPRKLEANKLHFRPILPAKERTSVLSIYLRACFSCGQDQRQVQEEPAQATGKYLTLHRTPSSRSSSSGNPLVSNSKDESEDLNGNYINSFCMISGSHASTLDRLYAWERKLYDEVKASEDIRREYNLKCKVLRQLESKGHLDPKKTLHPIDRTRAAVKDLYSRIQVAIHRIDSISKRIEELRDRELQPQLEELVAGLTQMWKVMLECHKLQLDIISVAYRSSDTKISVNSDSHRQIALHLENELGCLSLSFTKWIGAQKYYLGAINNWLVKCVSIPTTPPKRKKKTEPQLREVGPPIYATCGAWLDALEKLPSKDVTDSIKSLAAEVHPFSPHREKGQGEHREAGSGFDSAANLLRDDSLEDGTSSIERFQSSLVGFLSKMSTYAESSVNMYTTLEKVIQRPNNNYDKSNSLS